MRVQGRYRFHTSFRQGWRLPLLEIRGRVGCPARSREHGPFPDSLPPNPACAFQRTGLSSDLRRMRDGIRVDVVMAAGADNERLAPHFRHEGCPRGLARSGLAELPEPGDLVNGHRGAVLAQLAEPPLQPPDQFLTGVADPGRARVSDDRAPVTLKGYPAKPCH